MTEKLKLAGVATSVFLMTAAAVSAATVTNGSFEMDPGVAGDANGNNFAAMPGAVGNNSWDIWSSIPGWTTTNAPGVELQTENTIPLTPFAGDYYAELDSTSNTGIAQSIYLGAGAHELSFAYSPRMQSTTTNKIDYGIGGLFVDDINGPDANAPMGVWTVVTKKFSVGAAAGNYTLFFDAGSQSDSLGGFIDDIKVQPVPLPAAGFLLFGALGGLAAMRRRRKS